MDPFARGKVEPAKPEKTVDELVAEWNSVYEGMGEEMNLEDLAPKAYEEQVLDAIYGVCGESWKKALAVFDHKDNNGGWMYGNVSKRLRENAKEEK